VLFRAGGEQFPFGGDDLGREQVVAGKTKPPHQEPDAAAESKSGDAGGWNDTTSSGQTVSLGGGIHLTPFDAPFGSRRPPLRIDLDAGHDRKVDHETVIEDGFAGDAVTAAFYREGKTLFAGEADGGGYIGCSGTAGDQRRALVDHPIPNPPGRVVASLAWRKDFAG
jgi:hypothetical protein